VVPEFYLINNSTGTLFLQDVVGFPVLSVPPGATCTVTGTFTSTLSPSNWRAALSANGYALGCVGQTWQDLSASRAINTSYTNSTGRPVMVNIFCAFQGQSINLIVDDVVVAYGAWSSGNFMWTTLSAVVPPGSVVRTATSGISGYFYWLELR
jgi:hypothetical protein